MQVRRTDKVGTEAAFHDIREYMKHVDEWFESYEMRHDVEQRRVYLATDDPNVLGEAKNLCVTLDQCSRFCFTFTSFIVCVLVGIRTTTS